MEERRLLVAVALSLLILTGYSLLFGPRPVPREETGAPETPAATPDQTSPRAPVAPPPEVPTTPPEAAEPAPPTDVERVSAERERRVEVVAEDFTVAFTNRGAQVLSWKLARYLDDQGNPEEMVFARGDGLRPLDVETGEAEIDAHVRNALFVPSTSTLRVDPASPRTLEFRYADTRVEVTKRLTFQGSGLV